MGVEICTTIHLCTKHNRGCPVIGILGDPIYRTDFLNERERSSMTHAGICNNGKARADVLTCTVLGASHQTLVVWHFSVDTSVTSTLIYGVQIWGPSLYHRSRTSRAYDGWSDMERPLVTMISRLIPTKASIPHAITRAEVGAPLWRRGSY